MLRRGLKTPTASPALLPGTPATPPPPPPPPPFLIALEVYLEELPSADFLCAGPPCPPFSRGGAKKLWTDDRAAAFCQTLLCIKEQSSRTPSRLRAFVLEN
eukprot:2138050-Pyramimonas_sp.AAC.1